jgi:hypothetical protein
VKLPTNTWQRLRVSICKSRATRAAAF